MNYRDWLDRAVTFTRRAETFPGRVKVRSAIGPPAGVAEVVVIENHLQAKLPPR